MRNKPSVSVSEATPEMIKAFLGEGWDGKIPDSGMVELPATIRVTPQEYEEHKEEIDESAAMHGAEIVISEDTSCPCCKAMGQEVMPDGSIRQLPVSTVGNYRDRRKVKRKAQRKARKRNGG